MNPVLNNKESKRLEELYSLNLLDTEKEIAFDRITHIVSKAFDFPICLISLVEKDRQWFKSSIGLNTVTQTSREVAFCHYVVVDETTLVVENALKDPRFANNPLVTGELNIRFYAGAPLKTAKGNVLGSLCLMDTKPRKFTLKQVELLNEYAAFVMSEIELRSMFKENYFLTSAISKTTTGVVIANALLPNNPVTFINEAFTTITGYSSDEVLGRNCRFLQGPSTSKKTKKLISKGLHDGKSIKTEILNYKKDGTEFWNDLKIDPIYDKNGELTHYIGFQTDITEKKENEKQLKIAAKLYEEMKEAVLILDKNFNVISTNKSFHALIKLSKDDIIHRNIRTLLKRQLISTTTQEEILATIQMKNTWEGPVSIKISENKHKILWLRVDAILTKDGNYSNIVCMLRELSEKEQIQTDVKMAGLMQKNFLPKNIDNDLFSVESIFKPSQYISGDFFEYKWMEQEQKLIGILYDAMGHGVATALQTSALRVLFQDVSKKDLTLTEKVQYINDEIINYLSEESFVAAVYFELDVTKKTLNYVPCGINTIYIEQENTIKAHTKPAFLLGLFKNVEFEAYQLELNEGDHLFFLTDGFTDVLPSEKGNTFVSASNFFCYLDSLAKANQLIDDATALKLTLKNKMTTLFEEIIISKDNETFYELRQKVSTILKALFKNDHYNVDLAFNEAFNNAIRFSDQVKVTITKNKQFLRITVLDDGPGFDVKKKLEELGQMQDSLMEEIIWSESGRGIFIMHKVVDKVEYNEKGNQVNLYKNLGEKK